MSSKLSLNRRQTVTGLLAAPAVFSFNSATFAKAPMLGVTAPAFHRFKLGEFEITVINDGAIQLPGPHPIFGQNTSADEVQALAKANNLPGDKMEIGFSPVVVNTGEKLVLFDSGNGGARRPNAGRLVKALGSAGYSADQVDMLVLTHFHPDHIGGLMENGTPVFANAQYAAHETEFDFWTHDDRMSGGTERVAKLTSSNVKPLADKITMIKDGASVASGITAVAAHGHTPGHTAYHLESGGKRLLLGGDFCNHYVVSLQRPDWHVRFDMDKEGAVATRKKLLDMIAADKIPFAGYHMPFPAVGYVEKTGGGYRYVPASYQLNL
ncbi:MAG: MBL fold metallo-hydrolase [Hyphomicrobiales bacterium]|nr:MBL fold metallo-hydrolase [Hyphomicrobiales bacterium]